MFRYEILILTIPEITKDEASTLEFQIEKLINKVKGSLISFERWGKYRLAYPVRKNDYGVYFLVRFEMEDKHSISEELNRLFAVKFSDIVMRSFVAKLAPDQTLEYQKPPSLEDSPKRHISSFLEEKGLLKRSGKSAGKPAEASAKKTDPSSPTASSDKKESVKQEPKENPSSPKASSDKEESAKTEEPKAEPVENPSSLRQAQDAAPKASLRQGSGQASDKEKPVEKKAESEKQEEPKQEEKPAVAEDKSDSVKPEQEG